MKLIVGLGNPGKQYQKTRHNVGFMVLDALHKKLATNGISDWALDKKSNAHISGLSYKGEKVFLLKPLTFMNESGESVMRVAAYYKIPRENILVVHDDKDLALGHIKLQQDRGHAGHNGVRSIIDKIGTKNFPRIRFGIANEKKMQRMGTSKFVLAKFGLLERKQVEAGIHASLDFIQEFLTS